MLSFLSGSDLGSHPAWCLLSNLLDRLLPSPPSILPSNPYGGRETRQTFPIMRSLALSQLACQACLLALASASPAPVASSSAVHAEARHAQITPSPVDNKVTRTQARRGIISDITAAVNSDIATVLSGLGSGLPSWVASGVPNFFQGRAAVIRERGRECV